MAALDVGAFLSKQFVFVVGENQTAFTVHAAVIAKQSKALDVLINGPMSEAPQGKAIFEDVEEHTFIRFSDRKDGIFIEQPPPEPMPEVVEELVDDWGSFAPSKGRKSEKISKGSLLRKSLHSQRYETEIIRIISAARCEVRPNSNPTEDYTTVFLGHAHLYVFAEKWGIKSLATLALSKLHKTLTTFTLYAARRPDIVELLRYTFSNEHTPDLIDAVDELRSLVMLYTACEVENLIHCPEFLALIGEGGQLAQNLVQMLMKRIN